LRGLGDQPSGGRRNDGGDVWGTVPDLDEALPAGVAPGHARDDPGVLVGLRDEVRVAPQPRKSATSSPLTTVMVRKP
jgi:hypothetical protein